MKEEEKKDAHEEVNDNPSAQKKNDNLSDNSATDESKTDENGAQVNSSKTEKNNSFFGKKEKSKKEDKQKLQIEELETKNKELNDKFLRLYSEFDNYKKRTQKEKLDIINTASEKVIINVLPVVDDFERAIKANEKSEDITSIKDGFNLIYNKLQQVLNRFDVHEINAVGEVFDTDFHEAITHFPAQKEEDKGKVIDVTEKGYMIKDKVIRFSKVVVAN